MSDWEDVALGDLVEVYDARRVPLSRVVRSRRQGPYPYFGAQGIVDYIDDYIFDGEFLLVAEDGENLRSRKEPIARLVRGRFWVNNHAHILTPRAGVADDRFLLHFINHTPLSGRVTGAAQPKLTKTNLMELRVSCPSLATQRRIAAVLSAFDELIESNERRIELLEDLARSLYREWFVHFRFPGHEDVKLVDSALGLIPEGWTVACLGDLACTVVAGIDPSELEPDTRYVGLEHLPRRQTTLRTWTVLDSVTSRKLMFSEGDTLFGKIRPYFHKVVWAPFAGAASSDTIVLRAHADRPLSAFVNAVASSDELVAEAVATSNGTRMPRADPKALLTYRLPLPESHLLIEFERAARCWVEWSAGLVQQNQELAATRDLLLPRLVTGRLDISDIDLGVLAPAEVE
jgi:type I restriction enzyme S subunit